MNYHQFVSTAARRVGFSVPTFLACFLVVSLPAPAQEAKPDDAVKSAEAETRTESTILSASIGKWQKLIIRKGGQTIADDSSPSGLAANYFAVDIDTYTRDRDGQGVYLDSVTRLLHSDAAGVKSIKKADGVELQIEFTGSQGGGRSTVGIVAKKQADGDEVFFLVKFSGEGSVYDAFWDRFTEEVDGAEWVESIDKIRWKLELAAGASSPGQPPGQGPPPHPGSDAKWYTGVGGVQQGPFGTSAIAAKIKGGEIKADTLVWSDGMKNWQAAGKVPKLEGYFGGRAP